MASIRTVPRWRLLMAGGLICAVAGCQRGSVPASQSVDQEPVSAAVRHEVVIRQPPCPMGIMTSTQDAHGKSVTLRCDSCHSVRPADVATAKGAQLDEFHQGLQMAHGSLTCASCHNPADGYASLRLADGRALPFAESMTLCAQCHGPQFRDYQHGSHGGMTGHWDLTRGGRTRNHCMHCHDAHAPKYSTFMPVAGPRDRFPPAASGEHHE